MCYGEAYELSYRVVEADVEGCLYQSLVPRWHYSRYLEQSVAQQKIQPHHSVEKHLLGYFHCLEYMGSCMGTDGLILEYQSNECPLE